MSKKKTVLFAICLCGILLSGAGRAQAQDIAKTIDTAALLQKLNIGQDSATVVAEALPYAPDSSVVAISINDDCDEGCSIAGYILVVNNNTNEIVSEFYEPDMWYGDALRFKGVYIDTYPYQINKNERAFGISAYNSHDGRVNAGSITTTSLFVQRKDSLVRVLKNYEDYSYGQESSTTDTCYLSSHTSEINFTMDTLRQTNGYNNIIVKTKTTEEESSAVKGKDGCLDEITESSTTKVLRFIDGQYQECIDTAALLKKLNIQKEDCLVGYYYGYYDSDSAVMAAKTLPYAMDSSVVVIPKISKKNSNNTVLDCYILIVNNNNDEIVSKFYEPNAWVLDTAMSLLNITIDTHPYRMNKDERAFGIRVEYADRSRPVSSSYVKEQISLFVQQKDSLVRVLKNYEDYRSSENETDKECGYGSEEAKSVFIIDTLHQTNGANNIIVKTKTTEKTGMPADDGGCIEKITGIKTVTTVLRFIDGEYQEK